MKDQNQGKSGGQNSDFSQQLPEEMRKQMKGEHSLQVDQSGESFRQSDQDSQFNTLEQQQQYKQQSGGQSNG